MFTNVKRSVTCCCCLVTSQVADLAAATLLAAAAALRHQEPPNTLDASLLLLLLGHSAVTQQLPAELLPTSKPSYKSDLRSSCLDLAAAAADLMAVQQQYPDRFSYLRYHAAAVLWQWFGSGKHTFEQLTLLLPLLCPTTTPAAAAAAPAAAVLDRYGSEITMALMHNIEDDQQLAAAAAGLQLPVLLEDYKIELYGTLLPLSKYLPLRSRVARLAEKAGKTPRTVRDSEAADQCNTSCYLCGFVLCNQLFTAKIRWCSPEICFLVWLVIFQK